MAHGRCCSAAAAFVFFAGIAGARCVSCYLVYRWSRGCRRRSSGFTKRTLGFGSGFRLLCFGGLVCGVVSGQGFVEGLEVGDAEVGDVGFLREEFVAELALGLEFAEFGGAFVEEAVGLGSGAVDRFLDFFGVGAHGFHGIEDEASAVVEPEHEVGFDFTAAVETPHGSADFGGEVVFEDALGGEIGVDGLVEFGVKVLLVGSDEVRGGEEAVFQGVLG